MTEKGAQVELKVGREVDTTGWISCDTHIHTVTWSGHGDAAEWERVLTIAAEGVELPIATDHNHQIDYRALQKEKGASKAYTAVVGNEIHASGGQFEGHFNAFPLPPGGPIPDRSMEGWSALVAECREKGAKVVILNHPRWPNRNVRRNARISPNASGSMSRERRPSPCVAPSAPTQLLDSCT